MEFSKMIKVNCLNPIAAVGMDLLSDNYVKVQKQLATELSSELKAADPFLRIDTIVSIVFCLYNNAGDFLCGCHFIQRLNSSSKERFNFNPLIMESYLSLIFISGTRKSSSASANA